MARSLQDRGFVIHATAGTQRVLREAGVESLYVAKIAEGRPNVIDMMETESIDWIVNTPTSSSNARLDEVKMRASGVIRGIPTTTTLDGLRAAVEGLDALAASQQLSVKSLQEYHDDAPVLNLQAHATVSII